MPHPIYGDPSHELDTVHAIFHLPKPRRGLDARLIVMGRSETTRPALWVMEFEWPDGEDHHGYHVGDAASHMLMIAAQDHPTSQAQMDACSIGEGWAQDELPL